MEKQKKSSLNKPDTHVSKLKHLDTIEVYTDGSYRKKDNKEYCGYGIYFPNGEIKNIANSFDIKPLTNNRAELYAIYRAIKKIQKRYTFNKIIIYTDSEYSMKSLTIWIDNWKTNNWKNAKNKPVENQDIIKKIDDLLQKYPEKIIFKHVRSHTGKQDEQSINNHKADYLANVGASK